ncbi:MAG TPA: hypothetical protein VHM70_15225 [Polyangiaceae bacterium]|nr:hypothetical protein [Polyangiaceae bacterium]
MSSVQLRIDAAAVDEATRALSGTEGAASAVGPIASGPITSGMGGEESTMASDPRVTRAWRGWLEALARDPEAALAAAQAYQQLDADGRSQWLSALETDIESLGVPAVAVYAPLLAVESDPQRLRQIKHALAQGREVAPPSVHRRALLGRLPSGIRVGVLVDPVYLDFVQVLACAYVPGQRFVWVRHDPIATDSPVWATGRHFEGALLERVPLRMLVDDLARTIVAQRRHGGVLPDALCLFADLFGLDQIVGAADDPETSR